MTLIVSTRRTALAAKTQHQFVPGVGYIRHQGLPHLPDHCRGTANCAPSPLTIGGTHHLLAPPGGGALVQFTWCDVEKAWCPWPPGRGNRLAWTPAHLSRAGWSYVGPTYFPAAAG